MSEWLKVDPYHMRNGEWTISKAHSEVPKPYGLWHGTESKGFYASSAEALEQWDVCTTKRGTGHGEI